MVVLEAAAYLALMAIVLAAGCTAWIAARQWRDHMDSQRRWDQSRRRRWREQYGDR